MRFTRLRDLAAVAVVAGLVVHLVLSSSYDSVPPLPTLAGSTLAVIAIVEAVFGYSLRSRIRRRPGAKPVQPLTAARAVALAKASSLVGAIMFGAWGAVAVFTFPQRDQLPAASSDLAAALVGAVCAAGLVGAALWLEHCCRTPRGSDQPPDDLDGRHAV